MPGRIEYEFEFAKPEMQPVERVADGGPMRILVLGDFTGRADRGVIESGDALADRPTPAVDLDDLDDVLFRYAPRLHLPLADPSGPSVAFEPRAMDHFHPDHLFGALDSFRSMRELREGMLDPRRSAAEVEALLAPGEAGTSPAPDAARAAEGPHEDEGALFERLLGRKPAETPRPRPRPPESGIDITPFIRDLVRPWVVSARSTDREHLVAALDQALGMQMRAVLGQPGFHALESAWRGVEWLTRRVETSEDIELCVLDVSRDELSADLATPGADVRDSGLWRLLVERAGSTPGAPPWSLLAGTYAFGPSPDDVAVLRALGAIAARAGGPFLAAAAPSVFGCRSVAAEPDPRRWTDLAPEDARRWAALRAGPAARWIGLALPRFLLRLPYGSATDPIESFGFEEQTVPPDHEAYLWGNPSVACAMLLAGAFADSGWSMQPGDRLEIDDVPAHVFTQGDETRTTPGAECHLADTAVDAILARGVMPIVADPRRSVARLVRFQSLAEPATALAGPWG